jgi:septal ring factor EnvC (AmiA/AmiB activator)
VLRARIEALREELHERESDRREARDALRASEAAISDANRALAALEREAQAAREAIAQLAARRRERAQSLEAQEGALARLLAARAMGGAPAALRVLLSGEDPADAARRLHYLGYVSRAAARVIESHRDGIAEFARLRGESEERARELAAIEARGRADRERLLADRRERRRVLERIAGELRKGRREMRTLQADERRLGRVIEELGRLLVARPGAGYGRVEAVPETGAGGGPFSGLRGRLRLPVRGELAGRFGAPRGESGSAAKGIFIRAAEGEPVRAVAAGRVVYAEWMRGFGNLLIVDHGEAYLSVYANNESLLKQTGDEVASGEPLATVGASGGNEETGLYFELRHLGRAFDPLGWARLR